MPFHARRLPFVGLAFVLALLLSAYSLAPHRASAQAAQAASPKISGAAHFIQTAFASNTFGDFTLLSNIATFNKPNAVLFVTPNVSPFAVSHIADLHPVGVWYDASASQWAIFNEDRANMPVGAAFNVLVFPTPGGQIFEQTAAPSNIGGDSTFLNNAFTNNQPSAQLLITQSINPAGFCGCIYNPHNVGVWYNTASRQWAIFQEDKAGMTSGASFNVLVGGDANDGATEFLQTVTPQNQVGDATYINNTATNNKPDGVLFVTLNWNPGGACGCVYDAHPIGVRYDTGRGQWTILNEDLAAMPLQVSFNVLAFPS